MTKKCSVSADEKIWKIADALAAKRGVSRSEIIQHLIIYAGIVGGEYPLTTQILKAPQKKRDALLTETLRRAEEDEPVRNQKFWQTLREHAKNTNSSTAEDVSASLLQSLIDG